MRYSRNTEITKGKCQKQNKKLHRNWLVYFHHQFSNDARLQTFDRNYFWVVLATGVSFHIVLYRALQNLDN
jgi:hypothetical protein